MSTKPKRKGLPFSKLSAEAKEKAREWFRETDDISDHLSELFAQDLEHHYGLSGCEIGFVLGHCQRDGVCFWGHPDIDYWRKNDEALNELLTEAEALAVLIGVEDMSIAVAIKHRGNDYHKHSMTLEFEYDAMHEPEKGHGLDRFYMILDGIEKYMEKRIVGIADEMTKSGYKEIEYRDSEEYIDDSIEANGYRFTKEGEVI